MAKKRRIVYVDGYEHLGHNRTEAIIIYLNESERAALDDIMAVLEVSNISAFVRNQIFSAYKYMTPEQLQKLAEVAEWRAEEYKLSQQFK